MAAITSTPSPTIRFERWFPQFLRDELAPYPGRAAIVARITTGVMLSFILISVFRIHQGAAICLYYVFNITRESPGAAFKGALMSIAAISIGTLWCDLGAVFFFDYQLLHFLFLAASYFALFFISRVILQQSLLTTCAIGFYQASLAWEYPFPAELHLEDSLWFIVSIAIGTLSGSLVELLFAKHRPVSQLLSDLDNRMAAVEALLTAYAVRGPAASCGAEADKVARFLSVGSGRLRRSARNLEATGQHAPSTSIQFRTLIAVVGRLLDSAGGLKAIPLSASAEENERLLRAAAAIHTARTAMVRGEIPTRADVEDGTRYAPGVALLPELERSIVLLFEAFSASATMAAPHDPETAPHWFLPDAFANGEYIRFAIKGTLALMTAYVIYHAVAWPGISTSSISCIVIALSTIGASRQKGYLRLAGAGLGGLVAIAGLVFFLPSVDRITSMIVLLTAVTVPMAWVATASPRLNYAGTQAALGFYLTIVQDFRSPTSLDAPRDRLAGVLLAVMVVNVVFENIWPTHAAIAMRRRFAETLRRMASLATVADEGRTVASILRFRQLRDLITAGFSDVHSYADTIAYEFGPYRTRHLALRQQFLKWQAVARTLFLIQIAITRYIFERELNTRSPALRDAAVRLTYHVARQLSRIADAVEGSPDKFSPTEDKQVVEELRRELYAGANAESADQLGGREAGVLALAIQFTALSRSLESSISAASESSK